MRYDYKCPKCNVVIEIIHSIKEDPIFKCEKCKKQLERQISATFRLITGGMGPSVEDRKESEHKKKVKDLDRAVRKRRAMFGGADVGVPVDKPDPKHIIKKGRTIGGQDKEVDRGEFIKAAAKDNFIVEQAQKAIKKK